ncbi:streptomycin 6-kinase [Variovorax sp. EL159]|nr:streptomycin 6-kinase [Variovorax sp. EL159]
MQAMNPAFGHWLKQWSLSIDGEAFATPSSHLLPVRQHGVPTMLKVSHEAEEKRGHLLMQWWNGDGAARVLAHEGDALLLERAQGPASLKQMVHAGRDDEATRILCATAACLHAPRRPPPPGLIELPQWFASLWPAGDSLGGVFAHSARTARELLAAPRDVTALHGDIHHGNVLDFGPRGWLAIDPKCLYGERGFDHANIFCNPDGESALAPGRFARRVEVVAQATGIERQRLLQWVLAWAGLSAAWMLEDGEAPGETLEVAKLAASALGLAV